MFYKLLCQYLRLACCRMHQTIDRSGMINAADIAITNEIIRNREPRELVLSDLTTATEPATTPHNNSCNYCIFSPKHLRLLTNTSTSIINRALSLLCHVTSSQRTVSPKSYEVSSRQKSRCPEVDIVSRISDSFRFCKPGLCRHAVSVCPSVSFVNSVKRNKHIFKTFSPSDSHITLLFHTKRLGNIPTGTR